MPSISTPSKKRARTSQVAKVGNVTLNTRIARILSRVVELKRYNSDTSIGMTSTGVLGCYLNFLAGITQGTGQANRLGDQIVLDHIKITIMVRAQTAVASTLDTNSRIIVARSSDNGLSATTLTNTNFTDIVYSGYNVSGPLQTGNYKIYRDVMHYHKGRTVSSVISGQFKFELVHYFKNEKIQFRPGTVDVISGSHLAILQGLVFPGAITDPWTYYVGTTVGFRDA